MVVLRTHRFSGLAERLGSLQEISPLEYCLRLIGWPTLGAGCGSAVCLTVTATSSGENFLAAGVDSTGLGTQPCETIQRSAFRPANKPKNTPKNTVTNERTRHLSALIVTKSFGESARQTGLWPYGLSPPRFKSVPRCVSVRTLLAFVVLSAHGSVPQAGEAPLRRSSPACWPAFMSLSAHCAIRCSVRALRAPAAHRACLPRAVSTNYPFRGALPPGSALPQCLVCPPFPMGWARCSTKDDHGGLHPHTPGPHAPFGPGYSPCTGPPCCFQ